MMTALIKTEIFKIFSQPTTYISFGAIAAIVILIETAMLIDGKNYITFITQTLEQSFSIQGKFLNGYLICFIILQTLIVQMPLLVALVTGDLISGEAATGTIRLLLTKPVSRNQILVAKIVAGSLYTITLILTLGILALAGGILLFGTGDLVVLKSEELIILRESDVLWRFFAALVIAFISLSVIGSFSLMLSCFTDNSIGPIIASMAVVILFTIIGTLDVPLFETIKPFLFTTHMIIWRNLFDNPLNIGMIAESLSILIGHIALFLGIAFYHFNKKDILN
jgi:ABC-2 type transport system permease protein